VIRFTSASGRWSEHAIGQEVEGSLQWRSQAVRLTLIASRPALASIRAPIWSMAFAIAVAERVAVPLGRSGR
jgi:hypothetical protein